MMAGMFYSLKETAAKLGKTEQEVKRLAKSGTLREFRDGTNLLFKIDEVEALCKPASAPETTAEPEVQPEPELEVRPEDLELEPEVASSEAAVGPDELESLFALDEEEPVKAEAGAEEEPLEPAEDLRLEEALRPELADELAPIEEGSEPGLDLSDTQHIAGAEAEEPAASGALEDDILLAGEGSGEAELGAQDTALTGEGVSVLGESDKEYKLTDDTLAETMAGLGASGEGSLEEIEKDVNLDSFGSGSGLLDLSLQADDTSLGGILDEIYTPEDQKAGVADGEGAMPADIAAETEQLPQDLAEVQAEPVAAMPAMVQMVGEPEPDASSNMVGGLLILSLIVLVYTIIAAASAGIFEMVPAPVRLIEGFIWLVVGVLAVVVVGIGVVAFMKGAGPRPQKPKKEKEEKKIKEKKEKKNKKNKKAEEEAKE